MDETAAPENEALTFNSPEEVKWKPADDAQSVEDGCTVTTPWMVDTVIIVDPPAAPATTFTRSAVLVESTIDTPESVAGMVYRAPNVDAHGWTMMSDVDWLEAARPRYITVGPTTSDEMVEKVDPLI